MTRHPLTTPSPPMGEREKKGQSDTMPGIVYADCHWDLVQIVDNML